MARQATKACGNRYFEARMRAAKWNEKLSTRAGAIDYLPGVTEDSLKKYELDITRPPNIVVALMADAYNERSCERGIASTSVRWAAIAGRYPKCQRSGRSYGYKTRSTRWSSLHGSYRS